MSTTIIERDETITITLTGYQYNALISHLVSNERYVLACLLLKQSGMTLPEAMDFYKSMPEYTKK